jgi:site-specific DNA recombinase
MPQVKVIQPIAEQTKKLRVAAYARVSSDSADQLNSFATQVNYYTSYIQSKDEWEFAGLYADEAVSGTTANKRDDFQRLLADCRAGKIDRILVKSISRFARNTLDCIQTVRELKQLGIAVEFEKEDIDTGEDGQRNAAEYFGIGSTGRIPLYLKKSEVELSSSDEIRRFYYLQRPHLVIF